MKLQRWYVLAVCALAFGLLGGAAWAAEHVMTVDIPFDFAVEAGTLPAGTYDVVVNGPGSGSIVLRDSRTGEATRLSIVTRLADVGRNKAYLAFDKVADTHTLAEIHIPKRDGYALQGASADHLHEIVPAVSE